MGTCEGRFVSCGDKFRVSGCILPMDIQMDIWIVRAQWSLQSRALSLDVDSKHDGDDDNDDDDDDDDDAELWAWM